MTPKDIAVIITAIGVPCLMFLAGGIYHICNYIKSKRPHKSDDEEDNPITKFKDDLAEIYESNPNSKLKKLAQAVWNRVEEIEKWHNEEIHDWERKYYSARYSVGELDVKCDGYREELDEWTQRCEELQSKLDETKKCWNHSLEREANLRKANEGLHKLLKEEQEKNKIPLFTKPVEVPDYLIEKRFPGQTDPYIKITMDEEALKRSIPMNTGAIIHIDTEDLNRYSVGRGPDGNLVKDEPPIYSEEFIKKLRDIWGREASKAVALYEATRLRENAIRMTYATSYPHSTEHGKPEHMTSEEMQEHYQKVLYVKYKDEPLKCYSVSVYKNDGIRAMFTNWELCAPGITAIERVLSEDGIKVWDYKEMP